MDKERILQELDRGAKSWNLWRKRRAVGEIDLDGIELVGVNLDEYDLSKVSLRNSHITQCSFKGADLIQTNLQYSFLQNNDFSHAKLIAANLGNTDMSGSILFMTNMLTANTRNARLENIDFRGHDISGLMLREVSLAGSNLEGQQLARVDLSNSNLEGVNLQGADLSNTLFNNANLTNADVRGANLNGALFKAANLSGVDLSNLDLTKTDFSGANLSHCDLRAANLSKSKLIGANITGAKLWKLVTTGWSIASVECSYAYWDKSGKEKTLYRAHEFERIFAEAITIELRYPYRLVDHELATLPIFIEHLTAVHWGTIIRLKSISDVAGGALVKFVVEEVGVHNPTELKSQLQAEAERIQLAQLMLRTNTQLHTQLKEKIGAIREEFWPRLLELAVDHEKDQVRNLTILFMDLKGFSKWSEGELSEKLSLFRGLVKPILKKFAAGHPNMEGDSLRVTFKNASAGVSCACMIRNVLRAAGFELRIGMELGEVAVVHNEVTDILDLEGVAVSMAARMEAAAEPGEVLVSHKVRHYAQRSDLFHFTPRRVPLKKAIGSIEQGDYIECFAVEAAKNLQDAFA
ncbi:pentapeptide repeat-containing protein [Cellvibrio mixtus]|uniref:pentapeptide repeat-containing protein n=1 Tax=Cellvibrio mixtus TaxID=39650 RepID=UPI000587F975|nr:pentapeptide repeat-containing protein [Cellvibrio mixtus]